MIQALGGAGHMRQGGRLAAAVRHWCGELTAEEAGCRRPGALAGGTLVQGAPSGGVLVPLQGRHE
jgi:hypothetical protein